MATTLIEAIGSYLQSQGKGTLGTDLFLGMLPASPEVCTAVFENDGGEPLETGGAAATAVDVAELQVVVRCGRDDYATGRDKALELRALLGAISEQTLSGVRILRVAPKTWVIPAGSDSSDRPHFSVRFKAHVAP